MSGLKKTSDEDFIKQIYDVFIRLPVKPNIQTILKTADDLSYFKCVLQEYSQTVFRVIKAGLYKHKTLDKKVSTFKWDDIGLIKVSTKHLNRCVKGKAKIAVFDKEPTLTSLLKDVFDPKNVKHDVRSVLLPVATEILKSINADDKKPTKPDGKTDSTQPPKPNKDAAVNAFVSKVTSRRDSFKMKCNILVVGMVEEWHAKAIREAISKLLLELSADPLFKLENVYYDDYSLPLSNKLVNDFNQANQNINFNVFPHETVFINDPKINIVFQMTEGAKIHIIDALYLNAISPTQLKVFAPSKLGFDEQNGFSTPSGFKVVEGLIPLIQEFIQSNNIKGNMEKNEHNMKITQLIKQAQTVLTNTNIDLLSVSSLINFQYAVSYSDEDMIKLQNQYKISEYIKSIENNVTSFTTIKSLSSLFADKTLQNIWFDAMSIPVNFDLVIFSEYIDYGLLYVFVKVLAHTGHFIQKMYMPQKSYNKKLIENLDLTDSNTVQLVTFADGGLYELLEAPLDASLVINFQGAKDLALSQVMAYKHIEVSLGKFPSYIELSSDKNLVFHTEYDLLTELEATPKKPATDGAPPTKSINLGKVGGDGQNKTDESENASASDSETSEGVDVSSAINKKEKDAFTVTTTCKKPEEGQQLVYVYNVLNCVLDARQAATTNNDITSFNTALKELQELFTNKLSKIQVTIDIKKFIDYYTLAQLSTNQKIQISLQDVQRNLVATKDNEFYSVIQGLTTDNTEFAKLQKLSSLPTNLDVMIVNYSNMKKDYLNFINGIMSLFGFSIKTLYVDKQESSDDLLSTITPDKEVKFNNIYEALDNSWSVNLIINCSTQAQDKATSYAQKIVINELLSAKQDKCIYFAIEKVKDEKEKDNMTLVITTELFKKPSTVDKTKDTIAERLAAIKRFITLSKGKKIGEDAVEVIELAKNLEGMTSDDKDVNYLLQKFPVKQPLEDVYTDQVKNLVTLLVERDRKALSENILSNLDAIKKTISKLPKQNAAMVADFKDALSSFDIAVQITNKVLKSLERNITTVWNDNDALNDQIKQLLIIQGESLKNYTNYASVLASNAKESPTLIIKGSATIDAGFLLFLKALNKPQLAVFIYDFDNQSVNVKLASELINDTKFGQDELDKVYASFNVVDAIQSKIKTLKQLGKQYLSIDKKSGKKVFDDKKYWNELSEFHGIINNVVSPGDERKLLLQIASEYKDAYIAILAARKLEKTPFNTLHDITVDVEKFNKLPASQQVNIKDLIRVVNDAFEDDIFSSPDKLKYKSLVNIIKSAHIDISKQQNKQQHVLFLEDFLDYRTIIEAKQQYDDALTNLKTNRNSPKSQKLNILRHLFDRIYSLQFGTKILSKQVTKWINSESKFPYQQLFVVRKAHQACYNQSRLLSNIVNDLERTVPDIKSVLQTSTKSIGEVADDVVNILDAKSAVIVELRNYIRHNILGFLGAPYNYDKGNEEKVRATLSKPFVYSKNHDVLLTPTMFQYFIVPTVVDIGGAVVLAAVGDDSIKNWYDDANKQFADMLITADVQLDIVKQRYITKGKEFLAMKLADVKKEENIALVSDFIDDDERVLQELQNIDPSLSSRISPILSCLTLVRNEVIDKNLVKNYSADTAFKKEILAKMDWLHILIALTEKTNSVPVQSNLGVEIDKFQQLADVLKKDETFKEHARQVNVLISSSLDKTMTGGSKTNVAEANNTPEEGQKAKTTNVNTETPEANAGIIANPGINPPNEISENLESNPPSAIEDNALASNRIENGTNDSGDNKASNTGEIETSNSGDNKVSNTGDNTVSNTGEIETSNTGEIETSNSGDNKVSNTGDNKASNTGEIETSNSGDNKVSNTGDNKASNTGEIETSNSGDNKVSNTGDNKTSNSGDNVTNNSSVTETTNSVENATSEGETTEQTSEPLMGVTKSQANAVLKDGNKRKSSNDDYSQMVEDVKNVEIMRLINFLLDVMLKIDLKDLFDDITTYKIKKTNIVASDSGFQFGGGWGLGWNKKKASNTIPEFKTTPIDRNDPIQLNHERKSFKDAVAILFKDDPELQSYLMHLNDKYYDVIHNNVEGSAYQTLDIDANVLKSILLNDPLITKFIEVSQDDTTAKLLAKLANARGSLTSLLKDLKYDTQRITQQVKQDKLPLDIGQPQPEVQPQGDKQEQPEKTEQEMIASKVSDPIKIGKDTEGSDLQKTNVQQDVKKQTNQEEKPSTSFVPQSTVVSVPITKQIPNLQHINETVQAILKEMEDFKTKMKRKQSKWIDEIKIMLSQGELNLNSQIQSKVALLSSGKILEIERRKISIQLSSLFKKVIEVIEQKGAVNYDYFKKFFVVEKRRQVKAILDYLSTYSFLRAPAYKDNFTSIEDKNVVQEMQKIYEGNQNTFNNILNGLHNDNKDFSASLSDLMQTGVKDQYLINMRDKERTRIMNKLKVVDEALESYPDKIKYFYSLNYSLTEMFDAQFVIMYVIKAIRMISFQFSMNMATNTFLQKYDSEVYDKKNNPPSLVSYMLLFLAFDVFFNIFILVTLGLSGFLFKTENNTFPVDKYLFIKYGFDYAFTTGIIFVLGILIGNVIKQKKYFRYKTEGERGIRAFEEIMKSTAYIVTLLPMFMVVS
jgi:hypothetical protein